MTFGFNLDVIEQKWGSLVEYYDQYEPVFMTGIIDREITSIQADVRRFYKYGVRDERIRTVISKVK